MKKMEKTKSLFLISFFGCFMLPIFIILSSTFSIFVEIDFVNDFYNGIINKGGFGQIAVFEIIAILITLMLGLTLKLKTVESITSVEDVVKGKKSSMTINKIEKIELKEESKTEKRKEIKVLEKREVAQDTVQPIEIKSIPKSEPNKTVENRPSQNIPSYTPPVIPHSAEEKPKIYPNTKKYK